jgi:DNA-binding NarL/FixJ family response regulator
MITVLLADDQALVRAGLLRREPFRVLGEAATGDEAVRAARTLAPDVVLMDIRMPGLDGITATERIVAAQPACRVIILTTFETDEHVFAAVPAVISPLTAKTHVTRALGKLGLRDRVQLVIWAYETGLVQPGT